MADDAESGRPVAEDGGAGNLLEGILALADVVLKLGRREVVNAAVIPAVAGDFMAAAVEGTDQFGLTAGQLADDEEGGLLVAAGEFVEQPVGRRRRRPS